MEAICQIQLKEAIKGLEFVENHVKRSMENDTPADLMQILAVINDAISKAGGDRL